MVWRRDPGCWANKSFPEASFLSPGVKPGTQVGFLDHLSQHRHLPPHPWVLARAECGEHLPKATVHPQALPGGSCHPHRSHGHAINQPRQAIRDLY
uniref:Uncharacterized protein n=1 Tax=Falco tinnunculus TaxID=100819 RepID=A0A8C4XS10_FALTI